MSVFQCSLEVFKMIELALAKLFTLHDLRSLLNTLKTLQVWALTTFRFMVHKFN